MSGFTWGGSDGATWGGSDGGTWGSYTAGGLESRTWVVGPVRAHHVISDRATITRGEDVTYEVEFSGRVANSIERFDAIRDRIEYASENYVVTGGYEDGTPYFKERHEQEFSLLMKITPPPSAPDERGVWGVLTDAEDTSNKPLTRMSLELTLFVLARDTDYTSHEQVREVHEAATIIGES